MFELPAWRYSIQGNTRVYTEWNYDAAISYVQKKHFESPQKIMSAHMEGLLKVANPTYFTLDSVWQNYGPHSRSWNIRGHCQTIRKLNIVRSCWECDSSTKERSRLGSKLPNWISDYIVICFICTRCNHFVKSGVFSKDLYFCVPSKTIHSEMKYIIMD